MTGFANSQSHWQSQPKISNSDLYRCIFTDSLHGWVIADSGQIIATTNGGNSWTVQKKQTEITMVDLFFLNSQTGWVIGWLSNFIEFGTYIFSTTNGGTNWIPYRFPDTTVLVNAIYFHNQNSGFFGCASAPESKIYRTSNGGINWQQCNVDSGVVAKFPIRYMKFLNQTTGFASGGYIDINGVLWKTTDGGSNWSAFSVGPEPMNYISIWDSNHIVIAGGDFEYGVTVVSSSNSGRDWYYDATNIFGIGMSASHRTVNEYWIPTGFSQNLIYTDNNGQKYHTISSPDSTAVNCLVFTDSTHGYAVGAGGKFLKYIPLHTSIGNEGTILADGFQLHPNYPNPFNSATVINYTLQIPSYITITLYDISGRKIQDIFSGVKNSGRHTIRYQMNDFASGIYFYTVTSKVLTGGEVNSKTGKLVLVK